MDKEIDDLDDSEEIEDESITPHSEPKSKVTPSEGVDSAQRIIDELKSEIADIRKSHASDRKKSDEIIGQLTARIDELNGYIDGVKKQFEKARTRPKQTLVTPPPPPPSDANKSVPENGTITPKKKRTWW